MASRYYHTSLGWVGSLSIHVAVAVALYFSYFNPPDPQIKYIEISLGTLPGGEGNLPKMSLPVQGDPDVISDDQIQRVNNPVALPGRKYFPLAEDVIHLPSTKKTVLLDPTSPLTLSNKISVGKDDRRSSNFVSNSLGKKETPFGSASGDLNGTGVVAGRSGTGKGGYGSGDGIGDGISFGIQWANGVSRKLISGNLPAYPSGVEISAQIKLKVTVFPDGRVKSAVPAQKGETKLENAAISNVKFWQFEPLLNAQPQVEQICDVTFNFKLK